MDKRCTICQEGISKYKCSTCRIPYCSLVCYKTHKETPCQKVLSQETEKSTNNQPKKSDREEDEEEDESRLSLEQLQLLAQSPEIRSLIKNKQLQELISKIDESSEPGKIIENIRSDDEEFESFLQLLLQTTNPST
ncbi:unnamed protein product [Cunninghamella blakesleeana]